MPMEAEVVIIPDASPIMSRASMKTGTFHARADKTTPAVISARPVRRMARKPWRCVSRPRNSRLVSAPNMYTTKRCVMSLGLRPQACW